MRTIKFVHVLGLALAVPGVLVACKRNDTQMSASGSAATAPVAEAAAPAAPKLTVLNAVLAKEVLASGEITAVTTFSPQAEIKAVAIIEGQEGVANVKVELLAADGSKVADGTASAPVAVKAAVPVTLTPPTGGWAAGEYTARFFLQDLPSWEVKYTIVP